MASKSPGMEVPGQAASMQGPYCREFLYLTRSYLDAPPPLVSPRARARARSLSHPPAAIHVAAPECPHSVSLAWTQCIQPLFATAGCIAACVPPALPLCAPLPASCGPYAVRCSALLTRLCARSLVCSVHADNFFFIVANVRGRQGGNHGLTDLRLQWAVVLG
jgi:hypothetical protein